jgi:tetratricopeptide (TPR) repeat protein
VDQVAIQRDHGIALFSENMYQEASVEFQKVLNVNPEDKIARKYAHEIRFQQAEALFEKEDYLAARDQFKASIRYKKDCEECRVRMKESEDLYKEMHYKKGIQYFGKELLVEAIEEWELVKAVDPKYKGS